MKEVIKALAAAFAGLAMLATPAFSSASAAEQPYFGGAAQATQVAKAAQIAPAVQTQGTEGDSAQPGDVDSDADTNTGTPDNTTNGSDGQTQTPAPSPAPSPAPDPQTGDQKLERPDSRNDSCTVSTSRNQSVELTTDSCTGLQAVSEAKTPVRGILPLCGFLLLLVAIVCAFMIMGNRNDSMSPCHHALGPDRL
ncbi:hypothetical protein PT282_00580 [Bifidobacterium sp. ESL0763]|uniref:hypothetical protein n=1 Tax=Bifidobacterium sp. ESL0763 TaxID=2983227 RepID=UPI0023F98764|nr:hypothetical protein [Bifidobacterium sp. ESL0763]MDF7663178.1 hypothetical protein [Bifidobacterium sp. ESL0763]